MNKSEDGANKVFGQLFENLKTTKTEPAPYPFRSIFASLVILLIHNPLVFFGTAFVLMMLWNWFLPLLGVTVISYPVMLGLYLILQLFSWRRASNTTQSEAMTKALLQTPIATTIMFFVLSATRLGTMLGFGFIFHLFV